MPASRWNENVIDLLKWFEQHSEDMLDNLVFSPIATHLVPEGEKSIDSKEGKGGNGPVEGGQVWRLQP